MSEQNVPEDDVEERLDEDAVIVAALAELSSVADPPREVAAAVQFEPGDVPPDGTGLLSYVCRIQDWMRLSYSVTREAAPADQAAQLFDAMGVDDVGACYQANNGELALTVTGLDALRVRLERALVLKDMYLEAVETGGSTDAASAVWLEAWDEADDSTIEGNLVAKTDIWPIQDFASRARSERLELSPSYQRDDVWPTKDAQLLIESILRGIPLPSVILLRPDSDGGAPFEVVDGKQRLTSILRFMGMHPKALERVRQMDAECPGHNLKAHFETDYPKFRKAWRAATGDSLAATQEAEYYFPFRVSPTSMALKGELETLKGKYYTQIRDTRVNISGSKVPISDVFESAGDYKIPLIIFTNATPQQIHQVFSLYNRQGKHLNAEELRNAVYHDVKLMRALSVTSGDTEDLEGAAPFLVGVEPAVQRVTKNLTDYGFGTARYRRTKVLGWLASMLFVDSVGGDGKTRVKSTAKQINDGLLDRVKLANSDPFRSEQTICRAIELLDRGIHAHARVDAWADKFRDGSRGGRWQELQLVASALGVTMAAVVLGDQTRDVLHQHRLELQAKTASGDLRWTRPEKTQTLTQWRYIADVSLGILAELGVDPTEVESRLKADFGYSCVAGLELTRTPE
ncbi:MAG: DUF262 domain-containing protein [Acidimicrobiia bacterium]